MPKHFEQPGTPDFEDEESPRSDQLVNADDVRRKASAGNPKSGDKAPEIFPELTSGIDAYSEYLVRTGNPMLKNLQRQARMYLRTGKLDGEEGWKQAQKERMELLGEMMMDETRSEHLLRDARLTGDIRADALSLLRSIGAERGAQRVMSGEDPRTILQGYADLADKMTEESKTNLALRKVAYTTIEIRRAIEKILAQPTKNP